jgi:branched-chain amino acid aminotransferase
MIGNGGPGIQTEQLRTALVDIQRGLAPDPHGWVERVF